MNNKKPDWICHLVLPGAVPVSCNAHTHLLPELYGHPDFQVVVFFGGSQEVGRILNTLGCRVRDGEKFSPGDFVEGIYEDCRVRLDEVEETGRKVLRVVIPDKNNLFPEDEGVDSNYAIQTWPTDDLVVSREDIPKKFNCEEPDIHDVMKGIFSASFDMRLKGKREDVIVALHWLECSYDYVPRSETAKEMHFHSDAEHIGKGCAKCYTVDYDTTVKAADEGAIVIAKVSGECHLSAKDCFLCDTEDENTLSLLDACKELNITAELFSDGSVTKMAEHIIVGPDGLVCNDESKFLLFDFEDYPDYAAFKVAAGEEPIAKAFTEDMFNHAKHELDVPGIVLCDFFSWDEPYEWRWTLS